ncbi:hypothetical protein D3C73_1060860 [compost metagenome]
MVVIVMSTPSRVETAEDLLLVKGYVLLPILLDMLSRDIDRLQAFADGVIFHHLIFYLREMESFIFAELHHLKKGLKQHNIRIVSVDTNAAGIEVLYKVRGYQHNFTMLRSLVKAELMTTMMKLRRRL